MKHIRKFLIVFTPYLIGFIVIGAAIAIAQRIIEGAPFLGGLILGGGIIIAFLIAVVLQAFLIDWEPK